MKNAIVIVDYQEDFMPSGSLPVPGARRLAPHIKNQMRIAADRGWVLVMTRCWHPKNHCSFIERGGPWPTHCVQWTKGAEYASDLGDLPMWATIHHISKGRDPDDEQYSAVKAGLGDYLLSRNVDRVAISGVATEVCVRDTTLDLYNLGFRVVVTDAVAGLDNADAALESLQKDYGIAVGASVLSIANLSVRKPR